MGCGHSRVAAALSERSKQAPVQTKQQVIERLCCDTSLNDADKISLDRYTKSFLEACLQVRRSEESVTRFESRLKLLVKLSHDAMSAVSADEQARHNQQAARRFRCYLLELRENPKHLRAALLVYQLTGKRLRLTSEMLDYLQDLPMPKLAVAASILKVFDENCGLQVEILWRLVLFARETDSSVELTQQSLLFLQKINDTPLFDMALRLLDKTERQDYLTKSLLIHLCEVEKVVPQHMPDILGRLSMPDRVTAEIREKIAQPDWHFKPQTLVFLVSLQVENESTFDRFMAVIHKACYEEHLMLNAFHIDDLIEGLLLQSELHTKLDRALFDSADLLHHVRNESVFGMCEPVLDRDLNAELIQKIDKIRVDKQQALQSITADSQDHGQYNERDLHLLLHHSLPHAAEITRRTLKLCDAILPEEIMTQPLFRAIAGFIIEFHDFEQHGHHQAGQGSNEQQTVNAVVKWLIDDEASLGDFLSHQGVSQERISELRNAIFFMAHRIIVIGTTMIFGRFAPPQGDYNTDEASLFFRLRREVAEVASLHLDNDLTQFIDAITLLTAECDKNPAAHPLVMQAQVEGPASVRALLNRTYSAEEENALDQFINCPSFQLFYGVGSRKASQEAFLANIAANVGMCVELAYKLGSEGKKQKARCLVEFINQARALVVSEEEGGPVSNFSNETDSLEINLERFRACLHAPAQVEGEVLSDERGQPLTIADIFKELFIDAIPGEQAFARRQYKGVQEAQKALHQVAERLNLSQAQIDELFKPEATTIHADNLGELQHYFNEATPEKQQQLLEQLLLAVTCQAGHQDVCRLLKGTQSVPYLLSESTHLNIWELGARHDGESEAHSAESSYLESPSIRRSTRARSLTGLGRNWNKLVVVARPCSDGLPRRSLGEASVLPRDFLQPFPAVRSECAAPDGEIDLTNEETTQLSP